MRKTFTIFIVFSFFVLALSVLPSSVWAVGPGVKIGANGSFHPMLHLSTGFDSNVFQRSAKNGIVSDPSKGEILGSAYLNIRPGLEFDIPASLIHFNLAGYVNYSFFFEEKAKPLQQLTGKADLLLHFLESKPFSFLISNNFSRSSGDSFSAGDVFSRVTFFYNAGSQSGNAFLAFYNSSKLEFQVRPGGGALELKFGYNFQFFEFDGDDQDSMHHKAYFTAKWMFFSRTALVFDVIYNGTQFKSLISGQHSATNRDMNPIKGYIGLLGQFTSKLNLVFRIGGGYSLVSEDDTSIKNSSLPKDNYGMVLGEVILSYFFNPATYIRVGAGHDFQPSTFSNYFTQSSANVEFASSFHKFFLMLRGDFGFVQFGEMSPQATTTNNTVTTFNSTDKATNGNPLRKDIVISANLNFDYNVLSWLKIGLAGLVEYRNSNMTISFKADPTKATDVFDLDYVKFQALFRIEVAY